MNDKPYRVIVTGSRTWTDENAIRRAIGAIVSKVGPENTVIVHGACPHGADKLADNIARGWGGGLRVERWPADWRQGKTAGLARNQQMVDAGADVCLAFINRCGNPNCPGRPGPHGTHGATDCAEKAEASGILVRRWPE